MLLDNELQRRIYTRHDDVKAILRSKALYCDPRKARPGTFSREFIAKGFGDAEDLPMLLLDNPDQLAKLRLKPDLIDNAVEEMLRYDSPVVNSGRVANADTTLAGCPAHKGDSLTVSLAGANRDPAFYPDPDKFDIEREDTHHQSFGGGSHLCLGAHLARLEAQEATLALLARYPTLGHSERGHVYHSIPAFRGFSEFWVDTRAGQ